MSPAASLDHPGAPAMPWAEGKGGLRAWVAYISALPAHLLHRFRTGGIRFLLQFVMAGLALVVMFRLLTADAGHRYQAVFPWTSPSLDAPGFDGDLRIVAFGSQDVLGSGAHSEGRRNTWLQTLCAELNCSELVSLVPKHDAERSLAFKDAYANDVNALHNKAREADFMEEPAADYLWLKDQYPAPTTSPSLAEQIASFLDNPARTPRQTLWVFTFGTWEIWNLAAMPVQDGKRAVDKIADALVEQVEFLNHRALDPDSPAFSDFWANTTDDQIQRLSAADAADKVDVRRLESFRVLVPQLFDISLTPGWQERPRPSYPHTKAEQMRNAAMLTTHWNEQMEKKMGAWEDLKAKKPRVQEKPDGTLAMLPAPKAKDGEKKGVVKEESDKAKRGVIYAPYPRRMALISDAPKGLVEAMTEEAMHRANLVDSAGHGDWKLNNTMRFTDVWKPCIGGPVEGAEEDGQVLLCNSPDDHLFYDRFTVNQRASDEIARRMAGEVMDTMFRRGKNRV